MGFYSAVFCCVFNYFVVYWSVVPGSGVSYWALILNPIILVWLFFFRYHLFRCFLLPLILLFLILFFFYSAVYVVFIRLCHVRLFLLRLFFIHFLS